MKAQNKIKELVVHCVQREAQIKQSLQELQKAVLAKKLLASATESREIRKEKLRALEVKRLHVQDNIVKMEDEAKHLEDYLVKLEEQANLFQHRRQRLERSSRDQMPHMVYKLSLYGNITSLVWHTISLDSAKGFITSGGADITAFTPPMGQSKYETCNSLWELIDSEAHGG